MRGDLVTVRIATRSATVGRLRDGARRRERAAGTQTPSSSSGCGPVTASTKWSTASPAARVLSATALGAGTLVDNRAAWRSRSQRMSMGRLAGVDEPVAPQAPSAGDSGRVVLTVRVCAGRLSQLAERRAHGVGDRVQDTWVCNSPDPARSRPACAERLRCARPDPRG